MVLDEDKFYVDHGCPTISQSIDGSFRPKSYLAGVRCCQADGKRCLTPNSCSENLTSYDEAISKCEEYNTNNVTSNDTMRLCTKTELLSTICCGTGGNCDKYEVWTSTPGPGI